MRFAASILVAVVLAAPAAAHEARKGTVAIDHPIVRASLGRAPNTAAYFTIRNTGRTPDRLVGASCACAAKVELHMHDMTGGVMRMKPVRAIAAPAGSSVALSPGGRHAVMLTGLKTPIEPGTMVEMVLMFERAGAVKAGFFATRDVEREMTAHGRRKAGAHAH